MCAGSGVSVYSKPENQTLVPIVIRLLGKWQKLDCGKIKIQLAMQDVKAEKKIGLVNKLLLCFFNMFRSFNMHTQVYQFFSERSDISQAH